MDRPEAKLTMVLSEYLVLWKVQAPGGGVAGGNAYAGLPPEPG